MKTNKVENIIGSVDKLPTLPIIYTKLTNLLQSPNATAKMISDVISEDQSIAVRVLNLVNSAFYSLPQKIGNLKHAIVILGLNQIRNLVLVTSTIKMFREIKSDSSFNMQKFWEHSIGCAVAARVLAETAYLKSPDDVFTGGLLHDIGKLVHAIYLKEDFAAVIDDVRESGLPVIEVEKRIFGCDHTYTGRELAIKWNLSEGTVDMIRHHHLSDNSAELTKEISAVHIGNTLCIALGLGSGGEKKVPVAQMKAWEILDIEMNNLETIIERIDRLFNESVVILES
ncbi:MAG: HDOD domain-containing protein [Deltaproteobacteria bacterium]|jgi:putative nucleotidyltransferase with HDIG domain|nr:HDOD domain-containing protein [Deltaproteobacteria bacterium]MBW2651621.1 HDOD domain-containing protein [Deltaproteobacteria bacterium]MCK5008917.1 HDOD domain-containing protein [Deltaproteobacteria bacterium]NOQ86366.1 HDOD domain-containing protein [Deltaproteobacteria bacterium]